MLIACPSCQRQLNVPDHAAGKQVRCPAPDCGTIFTVSASSSPAVQPAAPRPVAAPPPAGGSAFDFGGGPVAGPEADFGFTAHDDGGLKGIGLRTRLNRASGWLNMAAGSMVLFTLVSIGLQIGRVFMLHHGQEVVWIGLVLGICGSLLLLPFAILVVVGARMLSRARRWGLAMTGTVVCLVIGVLSLLGLLGWLVALVFAVMAVAASAPDSKSMLLNPCGNALFLGILAFSSIFAGIVGLRTLLNAEVKETFS